MAWVEALENGHALTITLLFYRLNDLRKLIHIQRLPGNGAILWKLNIIFMLTMYAIKVQGM